jgi:8-oxo-dGTP pyrophosphatase MutT (NUDIX family)
MSNNDFAETLSGYLDQFSPAIHTEWDARLAAVLIPLFNEDDVWKVLFTRRTDHLDSHQGQVAFPGGAVDPQDRGPEAAALRETEEEIGIPASEIKTFGRLDSLLTVTQFQIVPIVGQIPWPTELTVNKMEVARVFSVPLDWLRDERNVEARLREFPPGGRPVKVFYFKPYDGEVIWGATARLTLNFLDVLKAIDFD